MRIGVTGHQDIPAAGLLEIRRRVREQLIGCRELVGVTSLAAGADQEFAEIVTALNGKLAVVVPSDDYETTFVTKDDRARFLHYLRHAAQVIQLHHTQPSEAAFFAAGQRVVTESDQVIAIWDGGASRGLGGTADVVAFARRADVPVTIIWPSGLIR